MQLTEDRCIESYSLWIGLIRSEIFNRKFKWCRNTKGRYEPKWHKIFKISDKISTFQDSEQVYDYGDNSCHHFHKLNVLQISNWAHSSKRISKWSNMEIMNSKRAWMDMFMFMYQVPKKHSLIKPWLPIVFIMDGIILCKIYECPSIGLWQHCFSWYLKI